MNFNKKGNKTMTNSKTLLEKVIEEQKKILKKDIDGKGYLVSDDPKGNLLESVSNWDDEIKEEVSKGGGGELTPNKNGATKFLAVHSSSALCVNNFAPFKQHYKRLKFLGCSGFDTAQFEKKLWTGISKPNLDFYLENGTTVIGIESKFTEYFGRQAPNHPTNTRENNLEPYLYREELNYLPEGFQTSIIKHYYKDGAPQHLDVAQLIKHTIGLLNYCRKEKKKKAILLYLYWEPLDWETLNSADNLFAEHRRNIEDFKHRIEQFVPFQFIPWSYPEFWKRCENDDSLDASLKEHIRKVRERYEFKIQS